MVTFKEPMLRTTASAPGAAAAGAGVAAGLGTATGFAAGAAAGFGAATVTFGFAGAAGFGGSVCPLTAIETKDARLLAPSREIRFIQRPTIRITRIPRTPG
ncbi:MAG: hypothetical protein FJW38_30700 [Acidobacteria bacterium]|nr:hypothetical protein [Acidobacteriota bacterium]